MTPELYHILLKNVILFSRPVDMASRTDTGLDQLNHNIDTTFSSVEKV